MVTILLAELKNKVGEEIAWLTYLLFSLKANRQYLANYKH
jgi:hypothetical protein